MVNAIGATSKILLSKVVKNDIKNLMLPMIEYVPKGAKKFSHVQFGAASNPKYSHEIVSFFDKDSNLIGRVSRETGKADIYTEYGPWEYLDSIVSNASTKFRKIKRVSVSKNKALPQDELVQGSETGFKFNLLKDKDLPLIPKNNRFLKILSEKLQCIEEYIPRFNLSKASEKISPEISYTGITRKYAQSSEIPNQICIQTVNARNNNIESKTLTNIFLKKEAKDVRIESFDSNSLIFEEITDNPFAQYLYLRPEIKAKYLTRAFAKKRGLTPLNIKSTVKIDNGNNGAYFESSKGEICYTKQNMITPSTSAHETDHAYQHALAAQNGKAELTPYEERAVKLLGECPKEKRTEAKIYEDAINNYPKNLEEIENLRKYPSYWNNELEKASRKREAMFEQYDDYPFSYFINETGF